MIENMFDAQGFVRLSSLSVIVILVIYIYNYNPKLTYQETGKIDYDGGTNLSSLQYKSQKILARLKKCMLPPHPDNGYWTMIYGSSSINSSLVPEGTVLKISCDDSYTLDGCSIVVCVNGTWTPRIGHCLKTCPSLYSHSTLTVTCNYKGRDVENCTDPFDGTYAQFNCGYFYKDIRRNRRKIFCKDGKWSDNVTECVPVCGQASVDPTLIVRGTKLKRGEQPWQVAIYLEESSKKDLICGGSLLSARVVLTAAHCVTNPDGDKVAEKDKFTVAVGKYYREFNDFRDVVDSQFSSVQDIIIDSFYKGDSHRYLADIAVIVTTETFSFSREVQPVCVDWGEAHRKEILNSTGIKGQVSGWGYTETGNTSDVLKKLEVPLIERNTCSKDFPEDILDYYTADKICAGYFNKGISVCKGDSGGGLVVQFGSNYYITGVVSISPLSEERNTCNFDQFTLYTNIYDYIERLILPKVVTTKPKFHFEVEVTTFEPPLHPSVKTCPPIYSDSTIKVTCTYNDTERDNCTNAIDGTTAKYKCEPFYESKTIQNFPVYCSDGSWSLELPQCVPMCGRKPPTAVKQGPFPWHVAIYNTVYETFVCSGTLLSEKLILTAAHCVTKRNGNFQPKEEFSVAAGKFYQKYGDARDSQLTQYSDIESISTPSQYQGYVRNYLGDIAIIAVKTPFTLSTRVRPVCIDWDRQYEKIVLNATNTNTTFFISGWGYYLPGSRPIEQVSILQSKLYPKGECDVSSLGDFEVFITDDKLCSEGLNSDDCKTYIGSGLVFEKNEQFYVAGVSSFSLQYGEGEDLCGHPHLFTQIYYYIDDFLLKILQAEK